MSKMATKAKNNIYYQARVHAAHENSIFRNRFKAALELNIDRNRIEKIELGKITPYQEEVVRMADSYNAPELLNHFCSQCPIGCRTFKKVKSYDIFKNSFSLISSLRKSNKIQQELIDILSDQEIGADEEEVLESLVMEMQEILNNIQAFILANKKRKKRKEQLRCKER